MGEKALISAAFQGGGAKGIAYAGALQALEENDYAFKAVAGTSAGSIVAALVAAGYTSGELTALVPELLSRVSRTSPPVLSNLPDPRRLGHFSLEAVRKYLESALRSRIRGDASASEDADVTFRELFEATGIELNILVTAAPGTPAVLNVRSAPDCQVSYAVAASSAIPFVMNPQLMTSDPSGELPAVVVEPETERGVLDFLVSFNPFAQAALTTDRHGLTHTSRGSHVVVDGGVWANYPGLCFTDQSLRHFYSAPDLSEFPVVGFILDDTPDPANPDAPTPRGHALRRAGRTLGMELLGALVRYRVAAFLLTGLALMFTGGYGIYRLWTVSPGSWDVLGVVIRLVATLLLVWIVVLGFLLGKITAYLPTAQITLQTLVGGLTSLTVKVPEWTGAHPSSRVIRVPASRTLIATVEFAPSPEAIRELVQRAHAAVAAELARCPLGVDHEGRRRSASGTTRFVDSGSVASRSDWAVLLGMPPTKNGQVAESGVGKALRRMGVK